MLSDAGTQPWGIHSPWARLRGMVSGAAETADIVSPGRCRYEAVSSALSGRNVSLALGSVPTYERAYLFVSESFTWQD